MKTDSQLQHDVMAELEWDPSVDHADIGVSVIDGVVNLGGHVKSYAEKVAAERAACRVSGVHAIAEDITVRLGSEPRTADHEIAKRILDVLKWNTLIPEDELIVKVEDGWVSLSGTVEWHYQVREAQKAAAAISGVRGISNNIEVSRRPTASDVKNRIEQAFKRQADLDAATVSVAIEGHRVTLGGKVKAWHEREAAARAAWGAPGVSTVVDHIAVG